MGPAGVAWRRLRWTTLCALIALNLCACGALKLAYEDGETFTLLWVGRYLALDDDQTALARQRLAAWFAWHRKTQLPDYARFAAELSHRVDGPVTPLDMEQIELQMRLRWHRMVDQALPDLADIALTLKAEQLPRLEKKFAANDQVYRDDFVEISSTRRKKDLYNKELDRIEYWYGSLDSEQKALLRKTTDALPIDPTLWLAEREAREAELVAVLREIVQQRPSREVAIQMLRTYTLRLETSPDAVRRAYIETLNRANRDMYLTIANMTNATQRAHAAQKLADWIDDFNRLASG